MSSGHSFPGKVCVRFHRLFLLFVLALTVLASGDARADGRRVRVGLFPIPPLLFEEEGEPRGFYVDLLAAVARDEGWDLEYVPGSWDENLDRLAAGTVDLLPTMVYTAARDSFADFTRQQVIMLWTEVYVARNTEVRNVLDLAGWRVAVMRGDINGAKFLEYIERFGVACEVVELPTLEDVFHAVARGRVLAGVSPNFYGYTHANEHGLKASPIIFAPYNTYFAVPEGRNRDLLLALDKALGDWHAADDSFLQARLEHWFGGSGFGGSGVARWLLLALGAAVVLSVLLVLWVRLLNHQVQRRTRELKVSEEQFRALFESAGDAILIIEDERFTACNNRSLELFGCAREDILGAEPRDFSPPVQPDGQDSASAASLRMAAAHGHGAGTFSWRHRRFDGSEFDAEVTLTAGRRDGRSYIQAIVRDVTARKQLEADLRQAQKMEAIGTLAGGIAHDFNNILSAILGYGELARMDAPPDSELRQNIDQVLRASERARDLVQQILAFSRRAVEERRPVEVGPIVREVLGLLRSSIPATIEVRQDLRSRGTVLGDPTSIYQVLMNLCTNAAQAMAGDPGVLEVAVRDEEVRRDGEVPRGAYVVIEVRDTGPGMSAAVLEKIFEPYFTTRSAERGTGLGLAVVHGIIEEHGGRIGVESREGEGTVFRIHLPQCERAADTPAHPAEDDATVHGSENILIVDDEEDIVTFCKRGLERLGYRVQGCSDPVAALELFRSTPTAYDVVVTDMNMPGMSGLLLAAAVRETRPGTPVVLCTGFADGVTTGEAADLGIAAFLMKPLVVGDLAVEIRRVLAAPAS
jgi:PAS domain S-box-containing protein